MIRLVRAELLRLRTRRMALITAIALLVGVGLFQINVNSQVTPPSAAEVQQQQQYYEQAKQYWTTNHEADTKTCVDSGETQANCEMYNREPTPADYALTATPFSEVGATSMLLAAFLAMLASYLVGSSFIGAEYSSGSLANWLTFVPQRLRVYGSKLLAVVIGSALCGAVVSFLALALAAALTSAHGGDLKGGQVLAETAGRAVVLAVVAGVVGFAIALVSRHTVAALGVVLGYLVVSQVLGGLARNKNGALGWLPPYLAENNVLAFLNHGTTYYQYVETTTAEGTNQQDLEQHLAFGHSATYWAVVVVVAVVGAALVFRRRDVT